MGTKTRTIANNLTTGLAVPGYTQATAVSASGQGSSITFTGIPAGTNSIIMTCQNMTTDSSAGVDFATRIGDSGGIETSGYSSIDNYRGAAAGDMGSHTDTSYFRHSYGFSATDVWTGNLFYNRISGNYWVCTYTAHDITEYTRWGAGHKELSGELTQIQCLWNVGSFDGGTVNIQYA